MGNKRNKDVKEKPYLVKQANTKVRPVRRSVTSLREDIPLFAIYLGMLVLLGFVATIVILRAPLIPSGPAGVKLWLNFHKAITYFNLVKPEVRPLIKEPVEKWSSMFIDANTGCFELGNNVWCARGTVDTRADGGATVRRSWIVYFMSDTLKPLYCKVGYNEAGDLSQALSLAQGKSPNGATVH